jgi:hypothetical protein
VTITSSIEVLAKVAVGIRAAVEIKMAGITRTGRRDLSD